MKKNGVLLLLGLIVLLGWWSTRSSAHQAPAEGILDVWATWGDDSDELQAFFDGYDQLSSVRINVTTRIRSDDLLEVLADTEPPDLVILSGADLVRTYHQQSLIEPLGPSIAAGNIDLESFYPALLEQCETADGGYLCLPWGGDVEALFWNKDLFAAAGLDPERPPQSMDELATFAGRLTRANAEGELSQVGFIPDFPHSHMALYARLFGGSLDMGSVAELKANRHTLIAGLKWQLQFYNNDGPDELEMFVSSLTPYRSSSHPLYGGRRLSCQQCHRATSLPDERLPEIGFVEGRLAMILTGQWQLNRADSSPGRQRVDFGVAPFPPSRAFPAKANSFVVQGPVLIIPARAADKDAAARLLSWMMAPEQLADAAHANAFLPAARNAAGDLRFQQNSELKVFLDLLSSPNATNLIAIPDSQALNEALAELEKAVLHDGAPTERMVDEFQQAFAPRLLETP